MATNMFPKTIIFILFLSICQGNLSFLYEQNVNWLLNKFCKWFKVKQIREKQIQLICVVCVKWKWTKCKWTNFQCERANKISVLFVVCCVCFIFLLFFFFSVFFFLNNFCVCVWSFRIISLKYHCVDKISIGASLMSRQFWRKKKNEKKTQNLK